MLAYAPGVLVDSELVAKGSFRATAMYWS